jgi:transcriptional regulator with XRE-family HTH domain
MAKKVRVTQVYIAMLEKGRENPTLDVLRRLSRALKITLTELLK